MTVTVCIECGSEPVYRTDRTAVLSGHVHETQVAVRCSNSACIYANPSNISLAGFTTKAPA
ncbi:hypothetical protein GCM10020360_27900 [Nonlabens tegetincola]